ncbi:MAG: hypothetical protein JWM11_3973 [Planctomycetaceae bacterium]|nr:hypothetical protein [Planctomycetaceae bacterium]
MLQNANEQELAALQVRVAELESRLAAEQSTGNWAPKSFYWSYYATTGFLLGGLAAAVSLLANVIAAPIAGKDSLQLIRIFLTFPLGEKALALTNQGLPVFAIADGVMLAIGCCLYLGTGMVLGVPLFAVMMYISRQGGLAKRILIASILALGLWAFNFYAILSWLQPALFGGHWITDTQLLPWWVAALTHLLFGWTLAVLAPLGEFRPYRFPAE